MYQLRIEARGKHLWFSAAQAPCKASFLANPKNYSGLGWEGSAGGAAICSRVYWVA